MVRPYCAATVLEALLPECSIHESVVPPILLCGRAEPIPGKGSARGGVIQNCSIGGV
jgi:hypothetical protein